MLDKHPIPRQVRLTKDEVLTWNDIIYSFIHIRRGKGFDPLDTSSELLESVQHFYYAYPFLFIVGDNGNLYPSKTGFTLGKKFNTYLKTNHLPSELIISQFHFILK